MTPTRAARVSSLRSMTGFGRAEVSAGPVAISVEARSLNHRHLDVTLRLPRALADLEMDARRLIQSRLERGRVEIAVQLSPAPDTPGQKISVDQALAAQYVARARALGAAIGIGGDVTLAWVLERPGVVRLEEADAPAPDTAWPILSDALTRALDELVARRTAEGEALGAELQKLTADLRAQTDLVEARVPAAVARREARLRERIRALLGEAPIDQARILGEVAIWAEKTDVREELTRLRAHLEQCSLVLAGSGARPMIRRRGTLFVVSAPSGAGKTTLCREMRLRLPDLAYSVSVTTRAPRAGEIDGADFRFVSEAEFRARLERGEFAEWATVHGHLYVPRARAPEESLGAGRDVLLDIDTQGAAQLRARYPQAVLVFIVAPSVKELEQRLRERRSDAETEIMRRLARAREEIALWRRYDYLIVNRDVKEAMEQLAAIIQAERCRTSRLRLTFPDLEVSE